MTVSLKLREPKINILSRLRGEYGVNYPSKSAWHLTLLYQVPIREQDFVKEKLSMIARQQQVFELELCRTFATHPMKERTQQLPAKDKQGDLALWRVGFALSCDTEFIMRMHKVMKVMCRWKQLPEVKAPGFLIAKVLSGKEADGLLRKLNDLWEKKLEPNFEEATAVGLTLTFYNRRKSRLAGVFYPFTRTR
jgi:hypothetical protein